MFISCYSHFNFVVVVLVVGEHGKVRIVGDRSKFVAGQDEEDIRGHFAEHLVQPGVLECHRDLEIDENSFEPRKNLEIVA
jgi:hypothetical protein